MNFDSLLVSTKFAPPRIGARSIPRRHLLEQLRGAQGATLSLVTGSAGFGKSILLAQWRQELMKAGAQVAWLSLSHDDRQLPNFCAYLLAGFQRLGIPVEDDMLLEGGSTQWMDTVVATVVRGAENLALELYLIIDDYHHVEDPWAHKLVQKLVDHCPDNLHLCIGSRVLPGLNVSRLRVSGQLVEIGFGELPFDLEETRQFFEANLPSPKLDADELRLAHDLTSGWPASLQLIAATLRNRPGARTALRDFGWRSSDLQSFLAVDVVAHLPPEFTEFLENISVCRRFNAALAGFVSESPQAAAFLKRAEDENLLVYRVESEERLPWYRFHPLFGEFLSQRLARRSQAQVVERHRRASQWFADHDFLIEAVRHALSGDDLDFAVRTIEHAAPATWSLGYISLMLNLLDRLPQETLHAHPSLFYLGCLTLAVTSRADKASRWIEQARSSEAARHPDMASRLALVDAAVATQRDETQRVIDLLEPLRNFSPENRFLRYVYLAALVAAYASAGRYADARRLLDEHPIPPEDRQNDMALVVQGTRATACLIEGQVEEAARLGAAVLARSETAYGRRSVCANLCAATLGDAFYELDRIDEAREVLANRTALLQASTPEVMVRATLCHARLDLLQDSAETAGSFLEGQGAHFQGLALDRPEAHVLAEQTRILLAGNDRPRARRLLARLDELAERHRDARGFLAEIPALAAMTRARLALASDQPVEALQALALVREYAAAYGRVRLLALVDALAALAHDALQREEEAMASLRRALQAGAQLGLIRSFVDEGPGLHRLLARFGAASPTDPALATYTAGLLQRLQPVGGPGTTTGAGTGTTGAPGTAGAQAGAAPLPSGGLDGVNLTPRELEILGLISQAMSNKRIALTLNITLETVKWNVKNILAKLGLSSRYDAMAWARKRGLIN